jgi:hypothetical protein
VSVVHRGKDTPEEIREKHIEHHMNYCVHYEGRNIGSGKSVCAAGEPHCDVKGLNRPGIQGHLLDPHPCAKWQRASLESAIEWHESVEASIKRMTVVGPVVAAWRNKPPRGKQEVIECPACSGRLHLSQSAYNGHVHGRCETPGCVDWME